MTAEYESTSERVAREAGALKADLRELIVERSTLTRIQGLNDGSGVVIVGFPTHRWGPIENEGRALKADLGRRHARFSELVEAILLDAAESKRKKLAGDEKVVGEAIEQDRGTYTGSTEQVYERAAKSIDERVALVAALFDPEPGQPVLVPDANAIVWNHHLDEWEFDGAPHFTVVLTSTLLSELDDLKMQHRNERVRESAESAIKQIKEFMGRGDIHGAGVTLRRDRSTVRMTAREPDMTKTLRWLDPTSKDDRLLASVLEVVREHPHSPVVLVTRDVNMQNKATNAGIALVEPPEPQVRPAPRSKPMDVRIVGLTGGEGSEQFVSFRVSVQNYEPKPVQATASASIDGVAVQVHPEELNLLANAAPTMVSVHAPRPGRADIVKALGDETTLYGGTLTFTVTVDGLEAASDHWRENIYSPEDNAARYEVQQQVWRLARGEGTPQDERAGATR